MQGKKKQTRSRQFFTPFGLILFILSVVYMLAEAIFNMQLLEVAGTVKSNPHEIDRLQYFGRSVSAYGFTLLTLGIFESSGFRLLKRKDWIKFSVVAIICLYPFFMIFSHAMPSAHASYRAPLTLSSVEIMISTLPLLGVIVAALSMGKYRPQVFLALMLIAWPAMFLGQKLLIENYVVDTTSWKERQNARYMLMLRAGLEDCVLHLGDLQLCNDAEGAPDMKATRIVMSALWMLNPDSVLSDLENNRNRIVESAAARGVWFSPREQYEKYLDKVAEARNRYQKQYSKIAYDKYYKPYKQASDMYMRAMDTSAMSGQANEGAAEVENGMEDGWKKYRQAVFDFEQTVTIIANEAVRNGMSYGSTINAVCSYYGDCPEVDLQPQIKDAQLKAIREFKSKTGYPPDIKEKAVFLQHPKTLKLIREKVQEGVRGRLGAPEFTLPPNWTYDRDTFKATLTALVRQQVNAKWKSKFGNRVPPGLTEEQFLAHFGIDITVPPVDQIAMSEDDFFHKHIVPGNQKLIQSMLDDLKNDRQKYHDSEKEMQAGKEYVEALYIPTISLVVSLSVVMLTLMRGVMLLPDAMGRAGWLKSSLSHGVLQCLFASGFVITLLALPHIVPNPYATGATYTRYLSYAGLEHPLIARLLNWAVHVQPVIYRAGNDISHALRPAGKAEKSSPKQENDVAPSGQDPAPQ